MKKSCVYRRWGWHSLVWAGRIALIVVGFLIAVYGLTAILEHLFIVRFILEMLLLTVFVLVITAGVGGLVFAGVLELYRKAERDCEEVG